MVHVGPLLHSRFFLCLFIIIFWKCYYFPNPCLPTFQSVSQSDSLFVCSNIWSIPPDNLSSGRMSFFQSGWILNRQPFPRQPDEKEAERPFILSESHVKCVFIIVSDKPRVKIFEVYYFFMVKL